jgi:hypothetical protein
MFYLSIKFLENNFDGFVLNCPRLRTSRQIAASHCYRLNELPNKSITPSFITRRVGRAVGKSGGNTTCMDGVCYCHNLRVFKFFPRELFSI